MTRRTTGISTAAAATGGIFVLGLAVSASGCTQQERTATARSAAQVASATVTTIATGQSTTPARPSSGIKLNGNGGFDASEAQQNALKRAYYMRDHHNDVIKPFQPTTQPTSQPSQLTTAGLRGF